MDWHGSSADLRRQANHSKLRSLICISPTSREPSVLMCTVDGSRWLSRRRNPCDHRGVDLRGACQRQRQSRMLAVRAVIPAPVPSRYRFDPRWSQADRMAGGALRDFAGHFATVHLSFGGIVRDGGSGRSTISAVLVVLAKKARSAAMRRCASTRVSLPQACSTYRYPATSKCFAIISSVRSAPRAAS